MIQSSIAVFTARDDNNVWQARSELPLVLGGDRPHLVRLTTKKSPGTRSLITRAIVYEVVGDSVRHVLYHQVLCSTPARVTRDIVQQQHHKALQAQDTWVEAIRAFSAAEVYQTADQAPEATSAGGLNVPA